MRRELCALGIGAKAQDLPCRRGDRIAAAVSSPNGGHGRKGCLLLKQSRPPDIGTFVFEVASVPSRRPRRAGTIGAYVEPSRRLAAQGLIRLPICVRLASYS